tara:strand:- start:1179 stop:1592 length:414 start_codon:yes stop_codon:yes gene_type:complete
MAEITGVVHGGTGVVNMRSSAHTEGFKNWVLTMTVDDININSLDDTLASSYLFEQRSAGLKDWEATCDSFDMSGLGEVLNVVGDAGSFVFTEGDATNGNTYTGNGIIDSISKVTQVGDVITCSVHVIGNGAITIGTL